jgi:hypothetical protein
MRICIPTGTADATGEKTGFQAKNGFFHSGVSFFALAFLLRFSSEDRELARKEDASGDPIRAADCLIGHNGPAKTARPERIQRNRKQHQHRAAARVFAGRDG